MMKQLKTMRLCSHFRLNIVNVSWNDCALTTALVHTQLQKHASGQWGSAEFCEREKISGTFLQVGLYFCCSFPMFCAILYLKITQCTVFFFSHLKCLLRFVFSFIFQLILCTILHLHTKLVKSNFPIGLFCFTETVLLSIKRCLLTCCHACFT